MQPLPQRLDGHRAPEQGALPQRAAVALQKRPLAMPMMVGAMRASVRWMPMLRTKLWSILSWSSGSRVRYDSDDWPVPKATLNKSPQWRAPWFGMGCKAQTTAIAVAIARICNAADRPKQGCAVREGLVQRCLKTKARQRAQFTIAP